MGINKKLSVGETILKLREAKTKKQKIEILKKNDTTALQCILRMNFDPNIVFALPDGDPPYKESPEPLGLAQTDLMRQYKKFYLYLEGRNVQMSQSKREQSFIRLLEALAKEEARILLDVKEKKLKCGLTKKILEEVYPGMIKWEKV